jgi:hypothetical protein
VCASATTAFCLRAAQSVHLQTVVNIASALVVAGKSVLVVAKMPVALGVFVSKLHRACGSDGVRILSSAGFMAGKTESKVRQVCLRVLLITRLEALPKLVVKCSSC